MISDELPNDGQHIPRWVRTREMARLSLLVDIFIGLTLLQISKSFGEMVIQDHRFVSKLADEQVFFLDFLFKRQSPFKVFGGSLERYFVFSSSLFCLPELLLEAFDLCLRILNQFTKLTSPGYFPKR